MADTENSPFIDKPRLYVNGFNVNNTIVDFQLYLYQNGQPVATLNIAPITAKNIAKSLLSLVESYEAGFETKVEDFNEMWQKAETLLKNTEGDK